MIDYSNKIFITDYVNFIIKLLIKSDVHTCSVICPPKGGKITCQLILLLKETVKTYRL